MSEECITSFCAIICYIRAYDFFLFPEQADVTCFQ
jgi:hypothetical protein